MAKAGALRTISRRSQSVLLAGQQHVDRRGHGGRHVEVMHLPVGDQDRPGHPGAGLFGQRLGQGGHQQACRRRPRASPDADDAQFGVGQRRDLGLDRGQRRRGLRGAVADALAGAVVDDAR